jgi:hypothetical protein
VEYYLAYALKSHSLIGSDEDEKKLQSIVIKIKDSFHGFATPREIINAFKWIKNVTESYQWIEKIIDSGYGYQDTEGRKKGVRLYKNE